MTPEQIAEDTISRMVVNIGETRELSGFAWAGIRVEIINAINDAVRKDAKGASKCRYCGGMTEIRNR